jgi:hypothetical protein
VRAREIPTVAERAALRALEAEATPAPWRAGELREAPVHPGIGDDGQDECVWCAEGPPVWVGGVGGHPTHRHEVGADHDLYGSEGAQVTGNYGYEEGGIVRPEDTRFLAAARNALPGLLDAADERDRLRVVPTSLTAMAALSAGDRGQALRRLGELGDLALQATARAYRDVAELAEALLEGRRSR